jgi:hypothetical protein
VVIFNPILNSHHAPRCNKWAVTSWKWKPDLFSLSKKIRRDFSWVLKETNKDCIALLANLSPSLVVLLRQECITTYQMSARPFCSVTAHHARTWCSAFTYSDRRWCMQLLSTLHHDYPASTWSSHNSSPPARCAPSYRLHAIQKRFLGGRGLIREGNSPYVAYMIRFQGSLLVCLDTTISKVVHFFVYIREGSEWESIKIHRRN